MANEIFTKFRGRSIVDILQRGADKQVASLRVPRNTKINWKSIDIGICNVLYYN